MFDSILQCSDYFVNGVLLKLLLISKMNNEQICFVIHIYRLKRGHRTENVAFYPVTNRFQ